MDFCGTIMIETASQNSMELVNSAEKEASVNKLRLLEIFRLRRVIIADVISPPP